MGLMARYESPMLRLSRLSRALEERATYNQNLMARSRNLKRNIEPTPFKAPFRPSSRGTGLTGRLLRGAGDVGPLDDEMVRGGRYAGYAAFDAAFILTLAPKPNDARFWDGIAARYTQAEKLLKKAHAAQAGPAIAEARAQAEAARATAASLRKP